MRVAPPQCGTGAPYAQKRHLGMIVGKVDVEEILGSIFKDFCIGK